ncbi:hypothetical protein E4J49_09570 [Vibrio parahaemolyticus]|nr:hypothetical protein [Vibrio parahaemolyticus]EGQ8387708.1 hypothetical protein [Vibrio parahaemolyticus]EGQ9124883.1 hypothetical protein [Vibrio parahaemolyticus]EGQ9452910.1 hypothetical protein [Vibrio parahaemolyticus]EGQ9543914.1 hypothetical protein [Vibrio parahaemolyticus]
MSVSPRLSSELKICLVGSLSSRIRPSKLFPSYCCSLHASTWGACVELSSIAKSSALKQAVETNNPPRTTNHFVFNIILKLTIKHCSILINSIHHFERYDKNLALGRHFLAIVELCYRYYELLLLAKLGG